MLIQFDFYVEDKDHVSIAVKDPVAELLKSGCDAVEIREFLLYRETVGGEGL